jgi:hypothetical protein
MEDRATEHRDPRRRVAEVARPEIAGIASFSRTPDARRRLPDFPFPGLLRVPSSLEPSHTVGFHTDIGSNRFYLGKCRTPCGWACPAEDKDGPSG